MGLSAGSLDFGVGGAELPSHSLCPQPGTELLITGSPSLLKLNTEGARKMEGTPQPSYPSGPMAPALCAPFTSQPLPTWAGE